MIYYVSRDVKEFHSIPWAAFSDHFATTLFGWSQKYHRSRAVDGVVKCGRDRCGRCMTAQQASKTGSTDGLGQRSLAGMLSLWYCQTSK